MRDNESVNQSSSHGGGEKCLKSGYILKIKPKQTKINGQWFKYGLLEESSIKISLVPLQLERC